jgi:hypothetical protein
MADTWQEAFLDWVEPIEPMNLEQTREVAAYFFIKGGDANAIPDIVNVFLGVGEEIDLMKQSVRMYHVGRLSQKANDLQASFGKALEGPSLDPSLNELFSEAAWTRLPDVARLHANAQASILRAIQRAADDTTDADVLRQLSEAYLTLPAPREDEHE